MSAATSGTHSRLWELVIHCGWEQYDFPEWMGLDMSPIRAWFDPCRPVHLFPEWMP